MIVVVVDDPGRTQALGEIRPARDDRGQPETDDVTDDTGREHLALRVERESDDVDGGESTVVLVARDEVIGPSRDAWVVGNFLIVEGEHEQLHVGPFGGRERLHERAGLLLATGGTDDADAQRTRHEPRARARRCRVPRAVMSISEPKWPWGSTTCFASLRNRYRAEHRVTAPLAVVDHDLRRRREPLVQLLGPFHFPVRAEVVLCPHQRGVGLLQKAR